MVRPVVFGTGQIGRPLVERLVAAGHDVAGVNRSGTGAELLAAHAAGRVEVAIGRASDYFGRARRVRPSASRCSGTPSPGAPRR